MIPTMTQNTAEAGLIRQTFPLLRPRTLAACAAIGARRYRRQRDLPGAVPGLLAGEESAILPRLIAEEQRCESARRARSGGYRPAQHVQILSALLAEAAAACPDLAAGAECADAPQPATPNVSTACGTKLPRPEFARPRRLLAPALRQAKASGSEPLRSAM